MNATVAARREHHLPVKVGTAVESSTAVLAGDLAAGTVRVAGVDAPHTLTVYGSTDGATYSRLYGLDGQAVTVEVAADGNASAMPDAMLPLRFIKLVADADLGAGATVVIALDS